VLAGVLGDLVRPGPELPGPCVLVIGAVAALARADEAIVVELALSAARA